MGVEAAADPTMVEQQVRADQEARQQVPRLCSPFPASSNMPYYAERDAYRKPHLLNPGIHCSSEILCFWLDKLLVIVIIPD